jgi:hypothetical protein
MTYQIDMRDALIEYLSKEFQGADIDEMADDESYSFSVVSNGQRYFLRVMFESVSGLSINMVSDTMQSFSVSQTMHSLGDFPVVVTRSGCIFGSP